MKKYALIGIIVLAVLLAACGPTATTPATSKPAGTTEKPAATVTSVEETAPTTKPQATAPDRPTEVPPPEQSENWNVQGSPDAPVTIIEYSDFQ